MVAITLPGADLTRLANPEFANSVLNHLVTQYIQEIQIQTTTTNTLIPPTAVAAVIDNTEIILAAGPSGHPAYPDYPTYSDAPAPSNSTSSFA
ncbi:hypothetical protein PG987_013126 [Apiospora arundinis]